MLCQRMPIEPLERIAIDIAGLLLETDKGNTCIMVVTDYFTKWVEAYALPNQEAKTRAMKLIEEFICQFGVPRYLYSDQEILEPYLKKCVKYWKSIRCVQVPFIHSQMV